MGILVLSLVIHHFFLVRLEEEVILTGQQVWRFFSSKCAELKHHGSFPEQLAVGLSSHTQHTTSSPDCILIKYQG